jgi:acyl-CoA synthetase (AMP-forming)/AMP-acid ligase II
MDLLTKLQDLWADSQSPFLIHENGNLAFADIEQNSTLDLDGINPGDVVAVIGDFEAGSINTLIRLFSLGAIVVPLTNLTRENHEYFFDSAYVDYVIEGESLTKRTVNGSHPNLEMLGESGHAGLVLFSTGTTGRPKAILHDFETFLKRFETPRPTLRTLNFLLFDHIGGINTLFHTLFNKGVVVAATERTVASVLETCRSFDVEVLPTTPTFLRMMLLSGLVPNEVPESLRIITYGTELMDQPTLSELCELLPQVDFRQTFGMSELGIVRAKSEARDSLFMQIGGEGVETKIEDGVLKLRSASAMIGYLNAPSPFDKDGWYDTKDVVQAKGDFIKIVGRVSDVVNVGGLKFVASEVEHVALQHPGVAFVKAQPRQNPVTGQHLELTVQPVSPNGFDAKEFRIYLAEKLPSHMVPQRIKVETVAVGHRFKRR